MISFKEWLFEVARSIPDINPDEIRVIDSGHTYYANFTYNDTKYLVYLVKKDNAKLNSFNVPNVYIIGFRGPNGYELTRNAGASAIKVYKYLIVAIKKIIDVIESSGKEINGFSFSGADETMELIYHKFYNDYLLPMGFVKVSHNLYLKKNYLKYLLQNMDSRDKMVLGKNIASQRKYDKEDLEDIRRRKIEFRKQKQQPTETPAGYPSGWGHV